MNKKEWTLEKKGKEGIGHLQFSTVNLIMKMRDTLENLLKEKEYEKNENVLLIEETFRLLFTYTTEIGRIKMLIDNPWDMAHFALTLQHFSRALERFNELYYTALSKHVYTQEVYSHAEGIEKRTRLCRIQKGKHYTLYDHKPHYVKQSTFLEDVKSLRGLVKEILYIGKVYHAE